MRAGGAERIRSFQLQFPLGHEPNGYFWEGVARYLAEAPALADRILYDPEGSMFYAYAERPSRDRD
jgi:hypothetical protein